MAEGKQPQAIIYRPPGESHIRNMKVELTPGGTFLVTGTFGPGITMGQPWLEFECPGCGVDFDLEELLPIGTHHTCSCGIWTGPLDADNCQALVVLTRDDGETRLVRLADWESVKKA